METMLMPRQLSEYCHGLYSEADIRAACCRDPQFNRLPNIAKGKTRPRRYIAISDFLKWMEEEKRREV